MANFSFNIDINARSQGINEARQELQNLKRIMTTFDSDPTKIRLDSGAIDSARARIELLERSIREAEDEGKEFGDVMERNMNQASSATERTEREVRQLNNALETTERQASQAARGLDRLSTSAKLATQHIRSTNEYMDRLKNNMIEGFGQTLAFGAIGGIVTAVSEAVQTVTQLDKVMTDIAVVSGKSADEMEAYRDAAGEAAEILGTTAREYMEAALIYEQQGGLAADYAQDLGKATIVGKNIDDAGSTAEEMSQFITAAMNGFELLEVRGSQAGMHIIDVLARLGSVSGSSLSEMAEGLQRTSNIARLSGYEFEQVSAAIATVSETTRRTASTIGNGFKSILTSFQQLREAGDDETEAFTNKIQEVIKNSGIEGISLFDKEGQLREAEAVMAEIGDQWDNFSREQQGMLTEAIAGKYQAEVFQSFMENQERYKELVEEAENAQGIAMQQQMVYMDSLEAKIASLKNAWQSAATAVIDTDMFKSILDSATRLLETIGSMDSGIAALATTAGPLVGMFAALFGGRIMAQRSQVNSAKGFSKDVEARLAAENKLTQVQREQLNIGTKQQDVVRKLGQHAGQVYQKNREELQALKNEMREVERSAENIQQKIQDAQDSWEASGRSRTPQGIDQNLLSQEYRNARQESFDADDSWRDLKVKSDQIKTLDDSIKRLKTNADRALSGITDDNAKLAIANDELYKMEQLIKTSGDGSQRMVDLERKLKQARKDTNLSFEEFESIQREVVQEMNEMNTNARRALTDQEESIANAEQQNWLARERLEIQRQIEAREVNSNRDPSEIQQEIDMAQASNDVLEEGAERAEKSRRATEALGMAAMGAIPMLASFKAAQEGVISTSEAMATSISGIGFAMLMMPGIFTKVVGGVLAISGVFGDFRSESEKLKDANEDFLRSFISLAETSGKNLSDIRSIKEEYTQLHDSQLDAQSILSSGSEEIREKYLSLAETIANSSPELVKYYDAEGNAIIDMTKNYEELHQAKLEDVRINSEMLKSNQYSFLVQYGDEMQKNSTIIAESNNKLKEANELLREQQEAGDASGVADSLKIIQDMNLEVAAAKTAMVDTRAAISTNIIQPVLEANEAVTLLKGSSEKADKALANSALAFSSSFISAEYINELMASGNIERVQEMLSLTDEILTKMASGSQEQANRIQEFIQIQQSEDPLKYALALQETGGSYQSFIETLKDGVSSFELHNSIMADSIRVSDEVIKSFEGVDKAAEEAGESASLYGTLAGLVGIAGVALIPVTGGLSAGLTATTTAAVGGTAALSGYMTGLLGALPALGETWRETERLAKELDKVTEQSEKFYEGIRIASKTVEGFDQSMGMVKDSVSTLTELGDLLSINPGSTEFFEGFKAAAEELPGVVAYSTDMALTEMTDSLSTAYDAIKVAQNNTIAAMMADNTTFYQHWLANNENIVGNTAAMYGIEASNFSTLTEFKNALKDIEAHKFHEVELGKVSSVVTGNAIQQDNTLVTLNNLTSYYKQGFDNWTKGFNYFSSESLTLGEKVQVALLMIVDGLSGMVAGAINTLIVAWNGFVNFIADSVERQIMGRIGAVTGFIDSVVGTDFTEDLAGFTGQLSDGLRSAQTDYRVEGKTLAQDFARARIELNEARKDQEINDIIGRSNMMDTLNEMGGLSLTGSSLGLPTMSEFQNKNLDPKGFDKDSDEGKESKEIPKKEEEDKKDKEKKEPKEKVVEDLDLELDRYYKLENALKVIENRLSDVDRAKGQAYGDDKIKLMAREQSQYASQIKVLQAYQAELKKEQREERDKLRRNGFKFDSSGEITNLNERLAALQNAANSKQQEAKEKAIENVKKLQERAQNYSNITFDLLPDKQQAIDDIRATLKEIEREKLEYKVSLTIDKNEVLNDLKDLMKELNGESYNKIDENYMISSSQLKQNIQLYEYYSRLVEETSKNSNLSDADRNELVKEYQASMYEAVSSAKSSYEELGSYQDDFIQKTGELLLETDEGFSKIASKAGALADAFEAAYGSSRFRDIDKIRDTQLKALDAQAIGASKAKDQMVAYRDSLEKGTESWKNANEIVEQLGDTIESALIEKIDLLKQKFEDFMEGLMNSQEKDLFGPMGLDAYEEKLDGIFNQQDKMLNTYEKITKIGQIMAEVNEAISSTTDPEVAEKYASFKDRELQSLLKAEEVSEAELERAKMLWDIEQKKMALEERKNATRLAQLVRDENGNMSYEYITQYDKSDNKGSSELASAQNDLYQFDAEQAREAQQQVLAVIKDTNDKIKDIYANTSLTEAERNASIEIIKQEAIKNLAVAEQDMLLWTGKAIEDGINSLSTAFKSGKVSFEDFGIDDETLGRLFQAIDTGAITVTDLLNGSVDKLSSALGISTEETNGVISTIIKATGQEIGSISEQLIKTSSDWTKNFESTLSQLETYYTQTQANIISTTDVLSESTGNLNNQINTNTDKLNANITTVKQQTQELQVVKAATDGSRSAYEMLTQALVGKTGVDGTLGALTSVRKEMQDRLQKELTKTREKSDELTQAAGEKGTTKALNLMGDAANYSFNKTKQFDSMTIETAYNNLGIMSNNASSAAANVEILGSKAEASRASIAGLSMALAALPGLDQNKKHYYVVTNKDGSISSQSFDKKQAESSTMDYVGFFDTGGMYGSWAGSSGNQTPMPAWLHEKELVLNKEDTKNFLDGIMAQREILRGTGGSMADAVRSYYSSNTNNSNEQHITIHAEFPDVQSSSEIERAFEGLAMRAATYAHRNS